MRQRVMRLSVGTVAVCGLMAGAGKLGLASEFAARQLVERLQAVIGAPVRIAQARLGYSSSALDGVEVGEAVNTDAAPAWASARAVEADLSLWQLLRGDLAGGTVTLRDVAVTLRFDRGNRLTTRVPVPPAAGPVELPRVLLDGGQFTLGHEGVPDEAFHNIRLELRGDGERLAVSGTVEDPDWGLWAVSGGRDAADGPFTLTLRTAREVHVTPALLRRAPFVPPTTWDHVELEGDTPCELTLRFEPGRPVHYRVVLDPRNTKVYVPSIKMRANGAQGRVVFEDNVLTLEKVRGLSAGGDLRVGSTMDFRGPGSVLRFGIEADGLRLRGLPVMWRVPAVEGQVSGRADLEVAIRDGHTTTRGRGEGAVRGLPLMPAIPIRLEADGRGLRFALGRG